MLPGHSNRPQNNVIDEAGRMEFIQKEDSNKMAKTMTGIAVETGRPPLHPVPKPGGRAPSRIGTWATGRSRKVIASGAGRMMLSPEGAGAVVGDGLPVGARKAAKGGAVVWVSTDMSTAEWDELETDFRCASQSKVQNRAARATPSKRSGPKSISTLELGLKAKTSSASKYPVAGNIGSRRTSPKCYANKYGATKITKTESGKAAADPPCPTHPTQMPLRVRNQPPVTATWNAERLRPSFLSREGSVQKKEFNEGTTTASDPACKASAGNAEYNGPHPPKKSSIRPEAPSIDANVPEIQSPPLAAFDAVVIVPSLLKFDLQTIPEEAATSVAASASTHQPSSLSPTSTSTSTRPRGPVSAAEKDFTSSPSKRAVWLDKFMYELDSMQNSNGEECEKAVAASEIEFEMPAGDAEDRNSDISSTAASPLSEADFDEAQTPPLTEKDAVIIVPSGITNDQATKESPIPVTISSASDHMSTSSDASRRSKRAAWPDDLIFKLQNTTLPAAPEAGIQMGIEVDANISDDAAPGNITSGLHAPDAVSESNAAAPLPQTPFADPGATRRDFILAAPSDPLPPLATVSATTPCGQRTMKSSADDAVLAGISAGSKNEMKRPFWKKIPLLS
ncbi:hypothetical protein BDK51DRAFT_47538 [Blyttiomyces helicus]|uniref:Uncharacterized protein n=1 Tax=Blyttiomyces helicus TaxID=388810 RepID=A0A4P9W9H9_9FUNG|nr:hypothetical protein BDK51DRAFT_47538 [Blyttiomyces helicus]|eukprot:RKO86866.1 hypothetical protein BDK51DRAFT_47538 [Blyttiomyces helicus]